MPMSRRQRRRREHAERMLVRRFERAIRKLPSQMRRVTGSIRRVVAAIDPVAGLWGDVSGVRPTQRFDTRLIDR